jgi:hypothetical protein
MSRKKYISVYPVSNSGIIREVTIPRFRLTGTSDIPVPGNRGQLKKSKIFPGTKTDRRIIRFAVEVHHKSWEYLTNRCALIYLGKMLKYFTTFITNNKQKTPVCLLRVDHGLPRASG